MTEKKREHKQWSPEELEYLGDSWGTVTQGKIAENLGRSISAIQQKAAQIGLGRYIEAGDYVSLYTVTAVLVGPDAAVPSYTIKRFLAAGIPHRNKVVNEQSIRVVNLASFWRWAEKHKGLMNFCHFEENALGKEPAWVKEKRRDDVKNALYRPAHQIWTSEEDSRLRMLLSQHRYTIAQLSEIMRRSADAIYNRIKKLHITDKPVKTTPDQYKKWCEQDIDLLRDNLESGKSYTVMAAEMNVSTATLYQKIRRIYGTANRDEIRETIKKKRNDTHENEIETAEGAGQAQHDEPHRQNGQ